MPTRKGAPARAPREHLEPCYGQTCAQSMVSTRRGKKYTSAQVRELVRDAVFWLHQRGWANPDTSDLHQYGPQLQDFNRTDLQLAIDQLIRNADLIATDLTPRHCHRPRPCYSMATLDYWNVSGGACE